MTEFKPMVMKATNPPIHAMMKHSAIFSRQACCMPLSVFPIALSIGENAQKVTMREKRTHGSNTLWLVVCLPVRRGGGS